MSIDQLKQLEIEIYEKMIIKARIDFYSYVKLMAPVALPEQFIDGVHIGIICAAFQDVAESVVDPDRDAVRLQLMMPPGSMKSKIASNLFPSWCLGRYPSWCFLAIGADSDFAIDNFGRPTKDLLDSPQYSAIFPKTYLRKDVKSAGRWHTTRKGVFVAKGVGQGIAGRRAHISICGLSNNWVHEKRLGAIQLKDLKERMKILGPSGYEEVTKSLVCHHKLVYTINSEVDTSPEHPFYVKGEGWVEAEDLKIGDKLLVGESLWTKIQKKFMIFGGG